MRTLGALVVAVALLMGSGVATAGQEPGSPTPTEELLSGMVTEEVEPGVLRVVNDGVRDLLPFDLRLVRVGQDGSIWGLGGDDLFRLGVAETYGWQLEGAFYLMDSEVAHDGTVWAVGYGDEGSVPRSVLRSFDRETWTTHSAVGFSMFMGDVEITPDGEVWAALGDGTLGYLDVDGSTWQTIESPPAQPLALDNVDDHLASYDRGPVVYATMRDMTLVFTQD